MSKNILVAVYESTKAKTIIRTHIKRHSILLPILTNSSFDTMPFIYVFIHLFNGLVENAN